MKATFLHIRDFVAERREKGLPSLRSELKWTALLLFGITALSLLLAPEGEDLDYQFAEEDGFATVLSSFTLAVAAAFAFVCLSIRSIRSIDDRKPTRMWGLFALGFAFLSIDEVFQIHEQIGWFLHDHVDSGPFRNWNDVVVIGYGLIAIPLVWTVLPDFLKQKKMPELLALGFLFYVAHTLTDSFVEYATTTSILIEESFKLACNLLIAIGVYSALKDELRQRSIGSNSIDRVGGRQTPRVIGARQDRDAEDHESRQNEKPNRKTHPGSKLI